MTVPVVIGPWPGSGTHTRRRPRQDIEALELQLGSLQVLVEAAARSAAETPEMLAAIRPTAAPSRRRQPGAQPQQGIGEERWAAKINELRRQWAAAARTSPTSHK